MKNNFYKFLCLTVLVIASVFIGSNIQSTAQESSEKNFAGVNIFSTPSGRVGFFEPHTGKIYLYDDNLRTCVFTGQLKELGQPIEELNHE